MVRSPLLQFLRLDLAMLTNKLANTALTALHGMKNEIRTNANNRQEEGGGWVGGWGGEMTVGEKF